MSSRLGLPPPPEGAVGWPWTEETPDFAALELEGRPLPTVTVVTPSFNQGKFLEATIRSVLLQGYPNLEYFVLDGGSTDDSVAILEKYSRWITDWRSGPDGGQSEAINRGLRMGSGKFACWLNSDDMLHPGALMEHARDAGFDERYLQVGDCVYVDSEGHPLRRQRGGVASLEDLLRVGDIWRAGGHIVQPEVMFPREAVLSLGGLDTGNHYTMDFELWGRLLMEGIQIRYTEIAFGMFRQHPEQKTASRMRQTKALVHTACRLLDQAPNFSEELRQELRSDLDRYLESYIQRKRMRGRAEQMRRWGVPAPLVEGVRGILARLQGRGGDALRGDG